MVILPNWDEHLARCPSDLARDSPRLLPTDFAGPGP